MLQRVLNRLVISSVLIGLAFMGLTSCFRMDSKTVSIRKAQRWQQHSKLNILIEEHGNDLKVLLRDPKFQQLDKIFRFDENGEQLKFSQIAYCDSCFQKYLSATLKITGINGSN